MALNAKEISFWVIGILTLAYCLVELGVALYEGSLTLLSDGFHNLSDVISLYIAFWASKASRRGKSDEMSYGWARTEILGALTNGVFLLSLVLYTSLEAIPLLIQPTAEPAGLYFVVIAALGLAINTIGTIVFAITGQAHGHSHAGGGGHGHSHGGHSHDDDDHGHSHEKKKKDHGHSHETTKGDDHHGHSHEKKKKHGDSNSSLLGDHDHDDHDVDGSDHGHAHKAKPKKKRDMNVHAVFLHYLGDMISSFFVLIAGILLLVFSSDDVKWVEYIDPITSLLICLLILITTLPLVRGCLHILLQSVPKNINLKKIKEKIRKVDTVISVHDFHVWQLTDGMVISSMHVVCEEGCNFTRTCKKIKKVLHKSGIHSTAIQPEYVPIRHAPSTQLEDCAQNCVEDCKEDWCCKKPGDAKTRSPHADFDPHHEVL